MTIGHSGNHRGPLRFLDFEASSLSENSFPIEVAWVDEDGTGECHLIRPTGPWLENGCPGWSAESERIHGIPLQLLLDRGVPAYEVAVRTAQALLATGAVIYSDAPGWDAMWLKKLLAVAGLETRVEVQDIYKAYVEACGPLLTVFSELSDVPPKRLEMHVRAHARSIVATAEAAEARRPRTRHRAMPDADSLWRVWSAVGAEVASDLERRHSSVPELLLFRATFRGSRMVIAHAETMELGPLLGSLAHEPIRDTLTSWSLVAIRSEDNLPSEIHALGWRLEEANTWITSPVTSLDQEAQMIRTRSGAIYRLGAPDGDGIRPDLLRHLVYALRVWGYVDVEP